jgi:hypothetical protein
MDWYDMLLTRYSADKGATLVIVSASLLFIFGLAAIVVDGGLGFSERRQAQAGADFGSLAAAQYSNFDDFPAMCPTTMSPLERAACRGAIEAKEVVDGNLGRVLDWALWDDCLDSEQFDVPAKVNYGSGVAVIDCISFSVTTQDVRVKVPILDVSTTFGRILGATTLNVDAFAEVQGEYPVDHRILPFGIPSSAGVYECLKSSEHPDWGVCSDGGTTGNYGYLDIPTYGTTDFTTFSNCTTPNTTLLSNMIFGVDHPLGSHNSGTKSASEPGLRDGNVVDAFTINVCPIFGSNANEVNVQTGVVQSIFEQGMTYGFGAGSRGPMWGSMQWKAGNAGNPAVDLDDTPLWTYFEGNAVCPGGNPPTNTQEMVECLEEWEPDDGVIFNSAIINSSRYNFAPRFWTDFGSGAGWYLIEVLEPIYVNTSYWGCNASGKCAGIHAPGDAPTPIEACVPPPSPYTGDEPADFTCADGLPLPLSTNLNAVTSFNLDRRMLPQAALDPIQADGPLINYSLTR